MSDQETDKYRYRLVEFVGEVTVDGKKIIEIVSSEWLQKKFDKTKKDFCYYPPKEDWPKLEKWLQDGHPFQNSWEMYEVEVLGKAVTLEKAKKRLEKLYKTRSEHETDSEVDSVHSGLEITRKRAASVLKTSYILEDIEEEPTVSPKRARKIIDPLTNGSPIPTSQTIAMPKVDDLKLTNQIGGMDKISNKMHPKTNFEEHLKKLRRQNEDDPTKMFFADYLDASLALLSYNFKGDLHSLRRCHQLDIGNHTNELKASMRIPTLPAGEKFVSTRDKLGMKIPVDTLEDFEKWEKLLDLNNAVNLDDVTQRRTALMELMAEETSSSNDVVKDTKKILPLFINKPVQLLYSGAGRALRGVAKKNFSKTNSYDCIRDFLRAKYKKSEKEIMLITTTSNWLSAAPDRDGGAAERRRART